MWLFLDGAIYLELHETADFITRRRAIASAARNENDPKIGSFQEVVEEPHPKSLSDSERDFPTLVWLASPAFVQGTVG
jgi:hypothetical protein